jgi:hypothetical protein
MLMAVTADAAMTMVRNIGRLPVLRIIAPAFDFDASRSFQPGRKIEDLI